MIFYLHLGADWSDFIKFVYRRLLADALRADLFQLAVNIQNKQLKNMDYFVELLWE